MGLPPGAAVALAVGVVAAGFAVFCLADLARTAHPRHLPKPVWALIICITIPWGGLAYLIFGRDWPASPPSPPPPAAVPDVPAAMPGGTAAMPGGTAAMPGGPAARPPGPGGPVEIGVTALTKRFGPVTAVDELSFTVRPGQVTGFLGPNGAGKTTTMRVILGLDAPTSGTALVGGRRYPEIIRPLRVVGSLLDPAAVHGGRTAWFHLLALARSNGIGRRRVSEVLELTGLEPVAGRYIRGFSLGMKQRLGIAAALLADPPVLVLDEPANGLDPEGIRWIRQLLTSMAAQGRTILVSSHLISEMALIADHLIIIGRGRLLTDAPTAALMAAAGRDVLVRSPRAGELAGLLTASGAAVTVEAGGGLAVTGMEAAAIGDLAAGRGIAVHELVPRQASLEAAYLDLTSGSTEYRAAARPPEGSLAR
jgi:ABC-2 type transport system ATP-binding protein